MAGNGGLETERMNIHEKVTVDGTSLLGLLVTVGMTLAACDTSSLDRSILDRSSLQTSIEGTGITNAVTLAAVSRGPIESTDGLNVKVNGIVWSAAAAKITIDGTSGQLLDLGRGTIVTLQGERTSADSATALAVDTTAAVRGPILSIGTGRFDVMGQIVVGDESTVLDTPGGSLDSLYVGQVVTVSGFVTAAGEIRATRVSTSVRGSGVPWIASSVITAFDPSRARFEINGLTVSYETLLASLPPDTIEVGESVIVFGSAFGGDGALLADNVSRYSETLPALPTIASAHAAMTGIVSGVEADGVFYISGQRIVRPPDVGVSGAIVDGSYVRVTGLLIAGELRATGMISATGFIALDGGRTYMLDGQIDAINPSWGTLRMLGLEFFVNQWTRMGGFALRLDNFTVGQWVQVWAHRDGFVRHIGGQWICCVGKSGAESAWFSSVSPPIGYTINSVADFTVQVTPTTQFALGERGGDGDCYGYDPVPRDEFWKRASGPPPGGATSVFSWGRFEGGILIADDVYICYPTGHGGAP